MHKAHFFTCKIYLKWQWCLLVPGLLLALQNCKQAAPKKAAQQTELQIEKPLYPAIAPNDFATFINTPSAWVDSVFNTLTPDERIAQLMIVEAFSNQSAQAEQDVLRLIKRYKIGGIIYFQGGPVRQARLTNRFQSASKVPLLISMDAESGVGMRLDSTTQFPLPMLLGALQNDSLLYAQGKAIALEFKRLGMHLNFAPVADVNNNPRNPIISYRAFGEEKHLVAKKSLAYMRGMQDNGIIAVAKHFPGHGDTDVDSHLDLPVITHSRLRLDTVELYPFRELIMSGVGGIMVAHMHVPSVDSVRNLPTSLSKPAVTGLLKNEMGYRGLIVTDAMVMKGVTKHYKPGEAEVMALEAGNDILERMPSVPKAIAAIRKAIQQGRLSQSEIDRRCKRVLAAKQWLGLDKYKPVELKNLVNDLNPPENRELNKALAQASVTIIKNEKKAIPISLKRLFGRKKIAVIAVGSTATTLFQKEMQTYGPMDLYSIPRKVDAKNLKALKKKLKKTDLVIFAMYGPDARPSNKLGFGQQELGFIKSQIEKKNTIVVLFDNVYAFSQFPGVKNADALVAAYQRLPATERTAAQLLFGKLTAEGMLPVTIQFTRNKYPLQQ